MFKMIRSLTVACPAPSGHAATDDYFVVAVAMFEPELPALFLANTW